MYKLQRAGTLELVLLEPICQGIQVEDSMFPNWSGAGRVSEKICPASNMRKSKFFSPPFLALLGGKDSDPP